MLEPTSRARVPETVGTLTASWLSATVIGVLLVRLRVPPVVTAAVPLLP